MKNDVLGLTENEWKELNQKNMDRLLQDANTMIFNLQRCRWEMWFKDDEGDVE